MQPLTTTNNELNWKSNDGSSRDFDLVDEWDAMEAANEMKMMMSVRDGVAMKIDLQTQDIIDMNIKTLDIKEVSNPIAFSGGTTPTIEGLYSDVIFGTTQDERRRTWGYIDLHTNVIHPYIYEILCKVQQNIDVVCRGEGSWYVDSTGQLKRRNDNDPDYDETATGIDWFIANYSKIKFKKNESRERQERLDFLQTFSPDQIVINKWLVMPVFYRDVETKDGPPKVPPISKEYTKLIRFSQSIQQETIWFVNMAAKYNIQKSLVAIRKYFQSLIEKSDGFLHQYVMGKNPDFGSRAVISCAVLDQYDKPSDDPIDMLFTGVPLAHVCVMVFPFVKRWIHEWFNNEYGVASKAITYVDKKGNSAEHALDDVMAVYTPDYIEKQINKWIDNYESRFDPVLIPTVDGNFPAKFRGIPYAKEPENPKAATISNRILTWTDLLYVAAVNVIETKCVWTTRYPAVAFQSTFPSKIHVLSTIKTMPVLLNGKIYKTYPIVDPDAPKDVVARSFSDTVTMSNMYLSALNGDYDGDTVSMRVPFLEESNAESEEIMRSPKQYLNSQGNLVRNTKNESYLMLYNLTKYDNTAGVASPEIKQYFLNLKADDIGIKKLTELFGTHCDLKTKEFIGPKYNSGMRVHLDAGEYINKTAVDTNLGLLIFNKILIEPYISKIIPNGYYNEVLVSKKTKAIFNLIGEAILYGDITTDEVWPFLKAFEFYTTKGVTIFSPSYTSNILIPKKELLKEKEEFFKKNPDASLAQVVELGDALSAKASNMLENDPGMPLFVADARGSVADNYRVMSIMVGNVLNPATGKFERIESDYVSGIKKEELAKAGNMVIDGVYPKACGTAETGYKTKQFNAVFQSIRVDKDGTDCGTKSYILVNINEGNWRQFEFQNVYDGSNVVPLTRDNYKKFCGHIVKMRSPMCCTNTIICSACAGRRPYILGLYNIGLQFSDMPNAFLEGGMKKFHVSTMELLTVDPDKLLI